jgi:multiple sugar transport system permease protein
VGEHPVSAVATADAPSPGGRPSRPPGRRRGIHDDQGRSGWLFVAPQLVLLGVFLALPIGMALWVSLTNWNGQGSPFTGAAEFVGGRNYARLFAEDGLTRSDFMTSLRNTAYYVALVVPLQTAAALGLALLLNLRLRALGFFRTAFYFPSVTSSVAISLVFIFLMSGNGAVNAALGWFGIDGPNWFSDPRGLLHVIGDGVGVWSIDNPPPGLVDATLGGLSAWDWLSGPSVAMSAIIMLVVWTTAGTFMLMFLAALQGIPREIEEAAMIDGAGRWQRFRYVTLPLLKPTLYLVLTLGVIGTWQVFDQIYVISQGGPAKTTLSPAYLSFTYIQQNKWGEAAAMAFVLFAIIIAATALQRFVVRDRDAGRQRRPRRVVPGATRSAGTAGDAR